MSYIPSETTLKNRATAMNQVSKAILSTVELLQLELADKPYESTYKSDGTLNKKTRNKFDEILAHQKSRLQRITIDDAHNSVSIEYTQIYNSESASGHHSTQCFKETVFIICKGQDTNTDRARYNVPTPIGLERYQVKWTCKKLNSMWLKVTKLKEQEQEIRNKISSLNYDLRD